MHIGKSTYGLRLGDSVGATVGLRLGDSVGASVGLRLGDSVGASVGLNELTYYIGYRRANFQQHFL